jgi:hypothetical protein
MLRRILAYLSCFFRAPMLLARVQRLEADRANLYQSNLDLTERLKESQDSFAAASAERSTALTLLELADRRADSHYADALKASHLITDFFAKRHYGQPVYGEAPVVEESAPTPPASRVQARRLAQKETQAFLNQYTDSVRQAMREQTQGDEPTNTTQ